MSRKGKGDSQFATEGVLFIKKEHFEQYKMPTNIVGIWNNKEHKNYETTFLDIYGIGTIDA